MQRRDSRLLLSATDLVNFHECEHLNALDAIGLPGLLGIQGSAQLFGERSDLVHYTSARFTRDELHWFAEEAAVLSDAVFVPLGPAVAEALESLKATGKLDPARVLAGLPHPSGANAERIAYFVGRKRGESLSTKTDPNKLDRARAALIAHVSRLAAA